MIQVFTRLMLHGKVRAAMRWVTDQAKGCVLQPTDVTEIRCEDGSMKKVTVMEALHQKHPNPQNPFRSSLVKCAELPFLGNLDITSNHILHIAGRIQGSAGPGGLDASHWQDALLRYGAHSERLRDAVAVLTRRLANTITPWNDIRALLANRLIALDKCPGVRPIGIGETLRRIMGKAVSLVTRDDVEAVCGVDQLCAGVKAGIEGAVHTMNELFEVNKDSIDGWGVLLVDATNAFNSVNRTTILWNARVLWPRCARFLFNTYRGWAVLNLRASQEFLYSKEGVTQGDPLSMFMYALGTLPLIHSLKDVSKWIQIWYADDATAAGKLELLRHWLEKLILMGKAYGYFPAPTKSYLIVSDSCKELAEKLFNDFGIKIVTHQRMLGGVIGDNAGKELYVKAKIAKWVENVQQLSRFATVQPQAAYAALTKSLQSEWSYFHRVVPDCTIFFDELEHSLATEFLPALFGTEVTPTERNLFSLPVHMGGLGIPNPLQAAQDTLCIPKRQHRPSFKPSKERWSMTPKLIMRQ